MKPYFTALLVICMTAGNAVFGQQPIQSANVAYAASAIESVRNGLVSLKQPVEDLRLESAGEPTVRPDCSALHHKATVKRAAPAGVPDAFVIVNIYRQSVIDQQAMVAFKDGRPSAPLFSRKQSPFSIGTMTEPELQQNTRDMESFFAAAVDVSRSSERFYPYLPDDVRLLLKHPDRKFRMYMPPGAVDPSWREKLSNEPPLRGARNPLDGLDGWKEKLSDSDLRRFVALSLDLAIQQAWLSFEGLDVARGPALPVQTLVADPHQYMSLLNNRVLENKQRLEFSGVLTREHLTLTSSYVMRLIGWGLVAKEVFKPAPPCPCFLLLSKDNGFIFSQKSMLAAIEAVPEDASLLVSLSSVPAYGLHFSRIDGRLRIVCVALP